MSLGGLQRRKVPHGVSKATRPFIFIRENSVKEGDKNLHLPPFNFSPLEQIVLITEGALAVVKVQMIKYQKNSLISEDVIALRELHSYTV